MGNDFNSYVNVFKKSIEAYVSAEGYLKYFSGPLLVATELCF